MSQPKTDRKKRGKLTLSQALLGGFFVAAGTMHFVNEKFYLAMIPEALPNKREIVQVSGVAEIAGGVAVLSRRTRGLGGKGLMALLVAVFPANINMAINPERFKSIPPWALWARLPLQFLAIAWAWRATQGATQDERAQDERTQDELAQAGPVAAKASEPELALAEAA